MTKFKTAGNFKVEVDDSGSTARDLTGYLIEIETIGQEYAEVDDTVMSDTAESVVGGIERSQSFVIRGFLDDTATSGPDVVLNNAPNNNRTIKITAEGSTRTFAGEFLCLSYKVTPVLKEYVMFEATFKQDGAITVAAS